VSKPLTFFFRRGFDGLQVAYTSLSHSDCCRAAIQRKVIDQYLAAKNAQAAAASKIFQK